MKSKKEAYKKFAKMDTFEREVSFLENVCPVCRGSKISGAEMCHECEQAAPIWVWVEKDPNDDGRLFQYER